MCRSRYLLRDRGWLLTLGIANGVANLWSWGVMHNYQGEPKRLQSGWLMSLVWVNMATTVLGIVLLIVGLVK